ncbi:MAG: glutathione S-transferase [Alphaproteobacteria bacterium]|nr:glutathione S-transferase [Alphaproteobacteria bacterium]
MKLFYSPTSPYARKVRIVILEKGLSAQVDLIAANPLGDDAAALQTANPLGKVPALVAADGAALYDSPVICEFLDAMAGAPPLIPASGDARWDCLRRQALADGVMDAAFSLVMESRRPEGLRAPDWIARWESGIARSVAAAREMIAADRFDLGDIALIAALDYLDFRLARLNWRAQAPHLARWADAVAERPSVKHTAPPAGA